MEVAARLFSLCLSLSLSLYINSLPPSFILTLPFSGFRTHLQVVAVAADAAAVVADIEAVAAEVAAKILSLSLCLSLSLPVSLLSLSLSLSIYIYIYNSLSFSLSLSFYPPSSLPPQAPQLPSLLPPSDSLYFIFSFFQELMMKSRKRLL